MEDRYNTPMYSGALLATWQFINSSKFDVTSVARELCVSGGCLLSEFCSLYEFLLMCSAQRTTISTFLSAF